MFARTYAPSKTSDAVDAWLGELNSKGRTKIAGSIADPRVDPELFEEGWEESLGREKSVPTLPLIDAEGELLEHLGLQDAY